MTLGGRSRGRTARRARSTYHVAARVDGLRAVDALKKRPKAFRVGVDVVGWGGIRVSDVLLGNVVLEAVAVVDGADMQEVLNRFRLPAAARTEGRGLEVEVALRERGLTSAKLRNGALLLPRVARIEVRWGRVEIREGRGAPRLLSMPANLRGDSLTVKGNQALVP